MGYYKAGKFWKDETLWKAAETKTPVMVDVREYLWEDLNWNMSKLKDIAYEIASKDDYTNLEKYVMMLLTEKK